MTSAAEPLPAAPAEEAARPAQEPLAAPVELAIPKARSFARLRLAAFLGALAAHLAVLYALTREAPSPMAGALGRLLDAVDISMINATALEARPDVRAPPASATPDAVETKEGSAESEPAPRQRERKEEKREPETLREEPVPIQPVEAPTVVQPLQEREKQQKEQERRETSIAADAGGAAARGDDLEKEKQAASAAASPGAVREYDGYVQTALTRARPKRGFGRGTVKVKFQLSPEGAVASVEISKSSGNKRLDDEAVATVRRAKFPRPPSGTTDIQRFYEFPIYFR
jgi:protein TonB